MGKVTPLKAIRKYCVVVCMNNQRQEVKLCPTTDCPFYKIRFGRGEKGLRPLKLIREQCLDCAETKDDIKNCPNDFVRFGECPIWIYRFGKRPPRANPCVKMSSVVQVLADRTLQDTKLQTNGNDSEKKAVFVFESKSSD